MDGDPRTLSGNDVWQVLEDSSGSIWVATYGSGLDRMDRNGNVLQVFRHDPRQPGSLVGRSGAGATGRSAGTLLGRHLGWRWTCSIAPPERSFTTATSGTIPALCSDSSVFSLYQDSAGLVWIGTSTGGVSRWDPRSAELGARQPDWLGKFVTAFADAPDDRVWVASMGAGLVEYDPDTGRKVDLDTLIGQRTRFSTPSR